MTLPVTDREFWLNRILTAFAKGLELHKCIYITDYKTWNDIQNTTAGLLRRIIHDGCWLLDAGCGYGALYDCLKQHPANNSIRYTGIDLSPDLIEIAKIRNPEGNFIAADITRTEYKDDYFDVAICRSVEGMLHDNCPTETANEFVSTVTRMSKVTIFMEYGDLLNFKRISK